MEREQRGGKRMYHSLLPHGEKHKSSYMTTERAQEYIIYYEIIRRLCVPYVVERHCRCGSVSDDVSLRTKINYEIQLSPNRALNVKQLALHQARVS